MGAKAATIGHISLAVGDFKKSVKFYDPLMAALGFKVGMAEFSQGEGIKSYHSGAHSLFIKWKRKKGRAPFSRDTGLDHLAFKVGRRSAVDAMFRLVSDSKTMITIPPKAYPEYSGKYYAFYFRDPDGIPLEVAFY